MYGPQNVKSVNSTSVPTKLPHSLNGLQLYGVTNVLIFFALPQNVCRSIKIIEILKCFSVGNFVVVGFKTRNNLDEALTSQ